MAKRRRFTPQFKAEVVIEVLMGQSSQAELCRRYNLSAGQLSKWKHQLVDNAATLFESTDKQSDDHNERIAQLEQLVGRLTIALDIQKKPRRGSIEPVTKATDGRGVAVRLLGSTDL